MSYNPRGHKRDGHDLATKQQRQQNRKSKRKQKGILVREQRRASRMVLITDIVEEEFLLQGLPSTLPLTSFQRNPQNDPTVIITASLMSTEAISICPLFLVEVGYCNTPRASQSLLLMTPSVHQAVWSSPNLVPSISSFSGTAGIHFPALNYTVN